MRFPTLSFPANFRESTLNAQGGTLVIEDTTVTFRPHSFNFGQMAERKLNIADIGGYSKGLLTFFSIWTAGGIEMRLVVGNKDLIIRELETRRRAIFESMGQQLPPLKYGNVKL